MDVFWLEAAIADIEEIVAYIAADNPVAARQVASGLYDAAARLGSHPRIGRRGRSRGTRELVVPSLPFIIAYRIRAGRVEVIRVIHGRRSWHRAFQERR
jgi:addiction module RelE/StbE family toxin